MQQQINICKSYIAILYNHDSKITNKCALNVVNSSVSVHENILQTNKCANSSSNLHSISCHFTKGLHEFNCRPILAYTKFTILKTLSNFYFQNDYICMTLSARESIIFTINLNDKFLAYAGQINLISSTKYLIFPNSCIK